MTGVFASTGLSRGSAQRPVVVDAERDIDGFNPATNCCNDVWDAWMGAEEALRGAFVQNEKGEWRLGVVAAASADARGVRYIIRKDANWYWGGRKVPVTYRDFVYTLQQLTSPGNQVGNRGGYTNLDPSRYVHQGWKQVTFFWRTRACNADRACGPLGNWHSLFQTLYPSFALHGTDFNTMWKTCICGSDGEPIADGPYYVQSYTKGVGAVLRSNPFWFGRKPSIPEIDFRIASDPSAEVQSILSGSVDLIAPTFGQYLEALRTAAGLTFSTSPGYYLEHLEFREAAGASNVLLRAPFMRQAISMAIDRAAIVQSVFGDLAGGAAVADNLLYYAGQAGYRPDFNRWNYNPWRALALLAKHCTGGPTEPDPSTTLVWQCSGLPATVTWTWPSGDNTRTLIEAIAKAELKTIGIDVVDRPLAPDLFYALAGVRSGGFDIADFAETTSGDPSDWTASYICHGETNYTGFCSRTVDRLLAAASRETDPARRTRALQQADVALSASVPVMPIYQRPQVVVRRSALLGVVNNPGAQGPFWNVENWRWAR